MVSGMLFLGDKKEVASKSTIFNANILVVAVAKPLKGNKQVFVGYKSPKKNVIGAYRRGILCWVVI